MIQISFSFKTNFCLRNAAVKPEKITSNAVVKVLNNSKNHVLCASNTRKVAALVSLCKNLVNKDKKK